FGIHAPELPATGEIEAVQEAFGAEGEDFPICNGGRGARALVETEVIAISCGIIKSPKGFSRARVEALDRLPVSDPMEQDQFGGGDRGSGETLADFPSPDDGGPFFGPGIGEIVSRINTIARPTEELRPITGAGPERDQKESIMQPLVFGVESGRHEPVVYGLSKKNPTVNLYGWVSAVVRGVLGPRDDEELVPLPKITGALLSKVNDFSIIACPAWGAILRLW